MNISSQATEKGTAGYIAGSSMQALGIQMDMKTDVETIQDVLNSKSENFLGSRIISLCLSINNTLFMNLVNSEKTEGPRKRIGMAQAWGEINKKYAFNLSKKHIQEDSSIEKKAFRISLSDLSTS